jgi:uncharacterized membrane protein YfcA
VQPVRDGLLFGATALAGAVNAVAGGGTLLSFPAAIAWGLPSPVANATNALAMCPGSLASAWAFRRELAAHRSFAALLSVPTIVGAVIGAALMRRTPVRTFDAIVPVLVFAATLALLLQGLLARRTAAAPTQAPAPSRGRTATAVAIQLAVGTYGGYFGAAMGIVMLASLALLPVGLQPRIAIKNWLSAAANGVAAVYFIASGLIDAHAAFIMVPAAMVGGFAGGHAARRAPPAVVRALVAAIGLGVSALLAYRAFARR